MLFFLLTRLDIKYEVKSSEVVELAFPLKDGKQMKTYLDVLQQGKPSDKQLNSLLLQCLTQNFTKLTDDAEYGQMVQETIYELFTERFNKFLATQGEKEEDKQFLKLNQLLTLA